MKKVASKNKAIEPTALYVHCFANSLNLALADTLKSIKLMSDTLDHCLEISKMIKAFPRRDALFIKVKEEMAPVGPGLQNLCPTRWTVCAASLQRIRENYVVLNATWHEALN